MNHSGNDATDTDADPLPCIPETGIDLFVGREALLQQEVTLVTHDQRTRTVSSATAASVPPPLVDRLRQSLAEGTGSGEVLVKCAAAIQMKAAHSAAAFCAEALSAILFMRGTEDVCPIAAETFVHIHAITSLVGKVATPAAFRDRVSLIVERRHRIDSVSDHRRSIRDQGDVDRDSRAWGPGAWGQGVRSRGRRS